MEGRNEQSGAGDGINPNWVEFGAVVRRIMSNHTGTPLPDDRDIPVEAKQQWGFLAKDVIVEYLVWCAQNDRVQPVDDRYARILHQFAVKEKVENRNWNDFTEHQKGGYRRMSRSLIQTLRREVWALRQNSFVKVWVQLMREIDRKMDLIARLAFNTSSGPREQSLAEELEKMREDLYETQFELVQIQLGKRSGPEDAIRKIIKERTSHQ
jgi:hypothetical protein